MGLGHLDNSLELFDAVDNVAELRPSPDLPPAVKVTFQEKSHFNFSSIVNLELRSIPSILGFVWGTESSQDPAG
jgi:hypothetical protein